MMILNMFSISSCRFFSIFSKLDYFSNPLICNKITAISNYNTHSQYMYKHSSTRNIKKNHTFKKMSHFKSSTTKIPYNNSNVYNLDINRSSAIDVAMSKSKLYDSTNSESHNNYSLSNDNIFQEFDYFLIVDFEATCEKNANIIPQVSLIIMIFYCK